MYDGWVGYVEIGVSGMIFRSMVSNFFKGFLASKKVYRKYSGELLTTGVILLAVRPTLVFLVRFFHVVHQHFYSIFLINFGHFIGCFWMVYLLTSRAGIYMKVAKSNNGMIN